MDFESQTIKTPYYLRNVTVSHWSSDAASHPRRPESFMTLLWKPQNSN